jgi:hypothetical protein
MREHHDAGRAHQEKYKGWHREIALEASLPLVEEGISDREDDAG